MIMDLWRRRTWVPHWQDLSAAGKIMQQLQTAGVRFGQSVGQYISIASLPHWRFPKSWVVQFIQVDHFRSETHGLGGPILRNLHMNSWFTSMKHSFIVDFPVFSHSSPPILGFISWSPLSPGHLCPLHVFCDLPVPMLLSYDTCTVYTI